MSTTTIRISSPLSFRSPGGAALPLEGLQAEVGAAAVGLLVQVSADAWRRVLDDQLFGAHPSVLPVDNGDFDLTQPVTLRLDLHPALAAALRDTDDPAAALVEGLATEGSTYRLTEHWRLRSALQAVDRPPALADDDVTAPETGFSTVWDKEHRAGNAPLPLQIAVALALAEHGLDPVPFNETTLRARVEDDVGAWTLVVMMDPGAGLCTVYSAFPRPISPEVRPDAVAALTAINSQLAIGALELDDGDGQLRVRTGVDLGGPSPGVRVLFRTIGHNLALMREAWATFSALAPG